MKFPSKPIQVVARGKHLDKDTYELCVHRYHDASKVIVLNKGYERMAVLTCCVTKSGLLEDEILISHSSTDIAQSIAESGLIEDTGRRIKTGYVFAHVYRFIGEDHED